MTDKKNKTLPLPGAGSVDTRPSGSAAGPQPAQPEEVPLPMGGYNGKILRVNLTDRSTRDEPISYEFARKYIGGAGFVAYYLWKELKGGIDPLGPENKIVIAMGPVTGLTIQGASRFCAGAKSPLTNGIIKTEAGGFWMVDFKRAGYDALIIEGQADSPVYLWITNGKVEIRDAGHLWGKETKDVESTIRSELAEKNIKVISIGIGGENMVRYACVMTSLYDALGRGGLGAVFGSKKLKAIAVRGHSPPPVVNPDYVKELRIELNSHPHHLSEYGTGGMEVILFEKNGNLPVRNFRDGIFPGVRNVCGVGVKETVRIGMEGCFACSVRCKKVVKVDEPYVVDPAYGGPEHETMGALGSDCGIDNTRAICKASERCNAYGIDTISTGSSLAFAIECCERGLLTREDTGGLELRFDDAELMLKAVEMIARREGFGNIMAEGTARMAKKIGRGSEQFAMNVKGLEAAMHDARVMMNFRLGYMLNPHGADHCSGMGGYTNPVTIKNYSQFGIQKPLNDDFGVRRMSAFKMQHCCNMANDCMVLCLMPNINFTQKLELFKAVTGWDTSWVELIQVGERVLTLMRLFNLREGFTDADDELPERFYQRKASGALSLPTANIPDKETMLKARQYYYFFMGWDNHGIPRQEKIEELEIAVHDQNQ
ncbi:MAG: aldehyde ferredoxin oxidoreductase family protein [Dehalococcoidales bacterium]|nr:aldehyde ferredoxin oxidoreductase family protein [Dehalococcoidales bacterium]